MYPSEQVYGLFRFHVPDTSIPAYDRAIFADPVPQKLEQFRLPLQDFRTSPDIMKGRAGLDNQGFTYVNHDSSLTPQQMLEDTNAETVYAAEILDMMLMLTGAKRGVVHNIGFRRRVAGNQEDVSPSSMRGSDLDQAMDGIPKKRILVRGKDVPTSKTPAHHCHVDMTMEGTRRTFLQARNDIFEAAKSTLEAEALSYAGTDVEVPRYAAYSVWRPLKPVKRDPIAVLDFRTLDMSELIRTEKRLPSGINSTGDYVLESYTASPPKRPELQKWYWIPEQQPNEVLIIKLADSAAEHDHNVAGFGLHGSPILPDTEREEARESCEIRLYLFWT